MNTETISFQIDFSKDEDTFTFQPTTLHSTGHRKSEPIYEQVQCSRFLMKRKTSSTNSAPRIMNDYGDLSSSMNKLSLSNTPFNKTQDKIRANSIYNFNSFERPTLSVDTVSSRKQLERNSLTSIEQHTGHHNTFLKPPSTLDNKFLDVKTSQPKTDS